MQLRAPAKINLSFQILSRRQDGFHEIETVMAPISLYDEITLTVLDEPGEIQFRCDDPTLPSGDDNLAVRSARLFLREAKLQTGISIELKKQIPHGAGLAGGSSDAATVLLGMNRIFDFGLTTNQMAALAAQLGSDVPFFIFQSAATCRGRGEIVGPLALPHSLPLLLLKPAFGVRTPWAYGRWNDSRELPAIDYRSQSFAGLKFYNDLERPVFEKHLFLAQAKMWLRAQAEVGAALMSGSGSTLFAVLRENVSANDLAGRAKAELDPELWTCACATL
ncbi:MAG: 4-(cytidine 5'-diphospho)-2-C-methyl-D-erythritol kinase [Verrucomicrobiota bacterium]|nr:4-(cytidine 5'-diphospho)-2-C-methyl-D-erythritol kinase [Verrucomicrobiota bacterium]